MKANISRQNIYLLALSTVLLIFVLLFSFFVLIPKGKEYRGQRNTLRGENRELKRYEDFNSDTYTLLKKLQSDNRHIITAFKTDFNADRFEKQNKEFFSSLVVSKKIYVDKVEDEFSVYEVNTTSHISSPKSFYNFLDSINKSDWIIKVNFPINFKRDGDMILSSFTMRVYKVSKDSNSSK
jgi:hypothetical protein